MLVIIIIMCWTGLNYYLLDYRSYSYVILLLKMSFYTLIRIGSLCKAIMAN